MTANDIREHAKEYEEYCQAQKADKLKPVDYDTWARIALTQRKDEKIEKRVKPSISEQTRELALKGHLVALKNAYYDELANAIWNKKKKLNSWKEQGHLLDTLLNDLRKKFQEAIEDSELA